MSKTTTALLGGLAALTAVGLSAARPALAQVTSIAPGVLEYGTENQMGAGPYSGGFNPVGFDPKAGATLSGLAPGAITNGVRSGGHTEFIASGPAGDFAGTDTIHVGSGFTGKTYDGYAQQAAAGNGVVGPDAFSLDYSSLLTAGQAPQTLTLGVALDDFQAPLFGNPYTATINGVESTELESVLNKVTLTDPSDQFYTFGIDPSLLSGSGILNLSIDESGNGGDGYGVDFLTVGVTTGAVPAAVPEASTTVSLGILMALGLGGMAFAARKRSLRPEA